MTPLRLAWPLALLAAPAGAYLDSVDTPVGVARVEGEAYAGGERVVAGGRVVLKGDEGETLWIEAAFGAMLLVARAGGGTACPALWQWVDAGTGAASDPFGTCSDLAEARRDGAALVVVMPSGDLDAPRTEFRFEGGRIAERPLGQAPSAAPPEAGAEAWIGRYPWEMFGASDWRGPLVALLGEDGYAEVQAAMGRAAPMAADGAWVAGGAFEPNTGAAAAVAIHRGDGRLLVALSSPGAAPRLWGDPGGPTPAEVAAVMAR